MIDTKAKKMVSDWKLCDVIQDGRRCHDNRVIFFMNTILATNNPKILLFKRSVRKCGKLVPIGASPPPPPPLFLRSRGKRDR